MAYTLEPGETEAETIRRCGREQLELAITELSEMIGAVEDLSSRYAGSSPRPASRRSSSIWTTAPARGYGYRLATREPATEAMQVGAHVYAEKPKAFRRRMRAC